LFIGRLPRKIPFTLHNPHADEAMVFQLGVTGLKEGWLALESGLKNVREWGEANGKFPSS